MSLTGNEKEQLFRVNRFFRRLDLHRNVLGQILANRQNARLQTGRPFLVSHRYIACMLGVQQAESFTKRLAINQYGTRIIRELVEVSVLRRYTYAPFAYEFALPSEIVSQALALEPVIINLLRISGIVFTLLRVAAYHGIEKAALCLRLRLPHATTGEVTPHSLCNDLGTSGSALCRDLKPARQAGLVQLAPMSKDRRRHEYCFPCVSDLSQTDGRFGGPITAKLISAYLLAIEPKLRLV